MSGIIGAENRFGKDFNSPDADMQGIVVSIYDIGCAVGSLFSFFFAEHYGRKKMIIAGGTTMVIGTAILASSTTIAQLLVGRIVTGLGNGFNSSNIPSYKSELCRPKNRAKLLSAQGTVTIVGLCIAYWMDFGLSYVDGPVQWRPPIAFQAFFAVFLVLQILPLPETPRFLIEKGRSAEAASILARLDNTKVEDVEWLRWCRRSRSPSRKRIVWGRSTTKSFCKAVLLAISEGSCFAAPSTLCSSSP